MTGSRRWLPALTPIVVAAGLALVGRTGAAAALVGVGVIAAGAIAAGVDVAGAVERSAAAAGRLLGIVLGGLAFAVLVLPAWAWSRVWRRDALRGRGRPRGWAPRDAPASDPRHLGSDGAVPLARPLWRSVLWGVEVVLLVATANFVLGWGWDRATGRSGPNSIAGSTEAGPRPRVVDPRIDSPAMADTPWAERYFADLQAPEVAYWPYVEYRPEPYSSPYLNLDGWTRRSYRTPGADDDRPVVWMFGGSTTFGEGQRDEHTIASALVRRAEGDDVEITIVNFGQRGWTHWQEMILFEQRLHLEAPPDLVVFYDGANEITAQALLDEAVPSNTLVLQLAERLTGASVSTRFVQGGAGAGEESLWHAYTQHSLAHKLVYAFRPSAAGAAASDEVPINTDGARPAPDGISTNYDLTVKDGTDAGRIYERGRRLSAQIAADAGVVPLFVWQPVRYEGAPQRAAEAELGSDVVDLSAALDGHDDVYIDGVHTNEEGARLAAEAIWPHLRPLVSAWYEDEG